MTKRIYACLASLLVSTSALADDAPNYKEDNLTGDWGGNRTKLSEAGVDIEAVYKADVFANVSGGIKDGSRYLDNLDLIATFDGEKLFGSKGTSAMLYILNNNGGRPDNDLTGSAQGIDNIEVSRATAKLYQAWIQQNFMDDRISVLAGLYDLNSEFYVTDTSGLFLHSTYGIGTDMAQGGQNGPSIFPTTSVAARLMVKPTASTYVQAAVLDGVPGDPNNPKGTHIQFNDDDGALIVGEAGFIPGGEKPNGKVAVGYWFYTEDFPDFVDVDAFGNPVNNRSSGAYIIGERQVYEEAEGQGLSLFARFGVASGDVNQFNYAWSAGAVYTGLFPTRDEGQLGFGIAGAHNSDDFRDASLAGGTPVDSAETAFELTYSDNITGWLSVQPDIQYIVNPGTDPSLDNALVLGTRFTINF